jgi:hypothetical protein
MKKKTKFIFSFLRKLQNFSFAILTLKFCSFAVRRTRNFLANCETNRVLQLALFTIVFAVMTLMSGCDMDLLEEPFTHDDTPVIETPEPPESPAPYLTIISLPRNTVPQNISNVSIYNAAGAEIAKCAGHDQIIITGDYSSAAAKIPLVYNDRNEPFADTGNFVFSLSVNINFTTQIIVNKEDKLTLQFTEGNALLDASLIPPAPPLPYLTITSLPKNVKPQNISNVFVNNGAGTAIAKCADYNQILITTDSVYAAAKIPLVYNGTGEPFRDTGYFIVSFSVNIDSYIQISKSREDAFSVPFIDGSGTFDLLKDAHASVELGYFSGGFTNPSDTDAPVIRSGTKFEMNGNYYTVNSNTAVVPSSFSNTCIVFIYARLVFNQLEFVYSTAAPAYDSYKKGYYNGLSRALFKFIFIRDSANKYFAKTFISNNWSHFNYHTVDSSSLASQNLPQSFYLSGADNPQMQTVTLPAGAYLFTLNGAAGGSSSLYNVTGGQGGAGGEGGAGGHISEVVLLSQNTSFTFFTGESGKSGSSEIRTTGNNTASVKGGNGGGSGSFAFSHDGYFLCAGGGGGSTGFTTAYGQNFQTPIVNPASGGAGGSIGGGSSGNSVSLSNNYVSASASGGSGGGLYDGITGLTVYSYSLGFNGDDGNPAAYFNLPPPNNWLNTNNANGRAADQNGAAQAGGNNRNSARGGGGRGNGSVTVFKIN